MRVRKVHIEVTNVCNLQCSFCPPVERAKSWLSVEDFAFTLAEVAPLADEVALHLMGEPLGHPDFPKLLALCEEKGVKVNLVTNGVLVQKHAAALLSPAIRQLSFSLHSYPDNFPDRPVGPYLANILALTRKLLEERPELYVNYRLWNLADPDSGRTAENTEMLRLIEKEFGRALAPPQNLKRQKGVLIAGRLYLHFDTRFRWPDSKDPVVNQKGFCYGLDSHFGVLADGTVVPCCLDKEGRIPLGNVRKQPLAEILTGERAQRMREGFRRGELTEDLCRRCTYIKRFSRRAASLSQQALAPSSS